MRLRASYCFAFFGLFLGLGCRKPLTPADNNQAPETWITSAPQDTITLRDKDGHAIAPQPGTIPVQYHVYWAGSDVDGAIAGFYYAVVETTTSPPPGVPLPTLPGPKPRDYRFTTRTDSTFIFNVSEASPDRQHAFFIYAVDNKGKPDPTPARFVFDAQDRYPPAIYVEDARSTAQLFTQSSPGAQPRLVPYTKVITDTFNVKVPSLKDTVPANGVLNFRWRGEPTLAGTFVTGYRYKLDEPQFTVVDSSVHTVTYNSGLADQVSPGAKQFTLRAVDFAGGARQTTRRFRLNISPQTWLSGPDPNAFLYTRSGNEVYYDATIGGFAGMPPLTGSLLSIDSLQIYPALRAERRTFFEIYKNRIYVRSENDTVNMNSWVVISSGGFDPDTPYSVRVSSYDPSYVTLPDTAGAIVLHPGPANGSPIGFKGVTTVALTPNGAELVPSLSALYPNFDPASVQRATYINGYFPMTYAGKAYGLIKAVDGFESSLVGAQDDVIPNAVQETARQLADRVDASAGTSQEIDARRRILTFYVDKVPFLIPTDPSFKPAWNPANPTQPITVYPSRTIDFYLVGSDPDPYDPDPGGRPGKPSRVGGPSSGLVLRWSVSFKGQDVAGHDVVWAPDILKNLGDGGTGRLSQTAIVLDPILASPTITMEIELCDCRDCEIQLGEGRCVVFDIPFTAPPPTSAARGMRLDHPGPGSSQPVGGRDVP